MTQLGEGVNVSILSAGPEKSIIAEVIEIEFIDSFKASLTQTAIAPPHWPATQNSNNESSKPVVFKFDHPGTQKAKVKVKITSKGYSGNGNFTGMLKGLEFIGIVPLTSGEHVVDVTLDEPPNNTAWFKGDIFWGVDATDISLLAGQTHVEIFFVFDDPSKQQCFASDGVWVEALRFLFNNSGINGVNIVPDAVAQVTQCCFDIPNHKYETSRGAASYGGATTVFHLNDYIDGSLGFVNCYDQTYAVIVFCAALGIQVDGLFLDPFGFIKRVNLVGWGPCNNPFPKNFPTASYLIVAPRDPNRSAFGNHMFCENTAKIYDACAGPAKGTSDRAGYITATIDTIMPPLYARFRSGTSADVVSIASLGAAVNSVR